MDPRSFFRVPWVHHRNSAAGEVCGIPRRQPAPVHFGDGGNLRVRVADGLAKLAAMSGNPREGPRRLALKRKDAPGKILGKHRLRRCPQAFAALAFAQQLNSIKDLRLCDTGRTLAISNIDETAGI